MAGDWIKVEHGLPEKPEVVAIAAALELDRFAVVGRLFTVWCWFDRHTEDGNARSVTKTFVDALVACAGFALALENVGWLSVKDGVISMPNFDRHLSKSSKKRALGKERSQRLRNAPSATKALPEKRREEKSNKKETKAKKQRAKFVPPAVAEVAHYCQERGNGIDAQLFVDHYAAKGWLVGRTPMRDWQAAVRTWEKRAIPAASGAPPEPSGPVNTFAPRKRE